VQGPDAETAGTLHAALPVPVHVFAFLKELQIYCLHASVLPIV
jgi:hypothetical protein